VEEKRTRNKSVATTLKKQRVKDGPVGNDNKEENGRKSAVMTLGKPKEKECPEDNDNKKLF
jgi:hypothetical protein